MSYLPTLTVTTLTTITTTDFLDTAPNKQQRIDIDERARASRLSLPMSEFLEQQLANVISPELRRLMFGEANAGGVSSGATDLGPAFERLTCALKHEPQVCDRILVHVTNRTL